jgi:hypothetical protein
VIKPLQRLCRYPLLLKEFAKLLSDDDPEREPIEQVIKSVQQIAIFINEQVSLK